MIAARALEQFLEELITKTASITLSLQAKTLTPEHIRQHIFADPRLSFLHDLANRMATGPNTTARSLSTSSAVSSPTALPMSRPSFQSQLSIPYQDPPAASTTNPSNSTNLLYLNQQLSRPYSKSFCGDVKSNKRTYDVVDEEDADEDDDEDEDADDDDDDDDAVRNGRLVTHHTLT